MAIPFWDNEPFEWDRLVLGSTVMPGVWDVDTSCRRKIDVKKSKGNVGALYVDLGDELSELDLVGKLATQAQWAALQDVLPKIHQRDALGKKAQPRTVFAISHPKTKLLGIQNVYVKEVRSPELERGILTIRIRCIEHVPKPKTVKSSKAPPVTLEAELAPKTPNPPNSTNKGP